MQPTHTTAIDGHAIPVALKSNPATGYLTWRLLAEFVECLPCEQAVTDGCGLYDGFGQVPREGAAGLMLACRCGARYPLTAL